MTAYRELLKDDRVSVRGGARAGQHGTITLIDGGRAHVTLDGGERIVIFRAGLERLPEDDERPGTDGFEEAT